MQNGSFVKIFDYHPYRVNGERNPNTDTITYKVMDLKNPSCPNHNASVDFLANAFLKVFLENFSHFQTIQVAIVPSSKVGKINEGLEKLVKTIPFPPQIVFNRDYLVRVQDIKSSHEGGLRSELLHRTTIKNKVGLYPYIPCIIIDDVKTTGASLNACEKIIREAGVFYVVKLAIGETV